MIDTSENTRSAKRRNLKVIMNRLKLTGTNVSVLLLFVMYGILGLSDALTCTYLLPDCEGTNCEEKTECEHGYCNVIGQCQCDFCFKGKSCSEFEDLYAPRFPIREDTIIYAIGSPAPVYKAHAEDGDLGLTCPLDLNLDCPCAEITYSLQDSWNTTSHLFGVDPSSGYVYVKEGVHLEQGSYHMLTIVASNVVHPSAKDALNLTVMVHTTDSLDQLLMSEKLTESVTGHSQLLIEDPIGDELMDGSQSESSMKTLIRKKRLSAGADNDKAASKLTLTEKTTPPSPLQPGNSIEYEVKVILPTLSTAMDLVVEIFVMDAVSGETPFALCSPTIVSVGTKISDDGDAALDIPALNANINHVKNTKFGSFYDRAVIDFGKVKNSDTVGDGTTDTTDSEIIISFLAVLIQNVDYLNDTVTVTAGAEYDQEKYVWVSQASHPVDMNPTVTYDTSITMTNEGGAASVAQWSGMTFVVDGFIGNPSGQMSFEAFTGNTEHDKFSVSHILLSDKGSTWACIPDDATTVSYKKSASGRSNHRAVLETMLISKDLDYGNLADATTNPDFKLSFAFSIFVMDALPGETVSVAAALILSDTNIWTATINLTVDAGNPAPSSTPPTAFTLTPVSSTEVGTQGTVTYGAKLTIPDAANSLVDCAIPGDADNYVCGVSYGSVGKNIAFLPNLEDFVVYDGAGAATFQVDINSTGPGANDIIFEVSIQYPTGSPGSITMTCNGMTIDLAATSTAAGIEDMSGESFSLVTGTDATWYEGSQGGILVVLKFPKNGAPYNNLILETAGDLEVTGWGTEVCKAEIMSSGSGVPCIAGRKKTVNEGYTIQKARDDSVYDDSVQMDLGPGCGVNRLISSDKDYEVRLRFIYQIPLGQTLPATENFNVSVGLSLDDNLIWTGWNPLLIASGPPAAADAKVPIFVLVDPAVQTVDPGVPYLVKVNLKIHPETVGVYKINAVTSSVDELIICRVFLLAIGGNFPCVDPEPYGKDKDPLQVTKIIHDAANWGAGVDIDFGTLRNMGQGSIFSEVIADDDTIAIGFMVRGVVPGAPTLTVTLDNTGTTTPLVQSFTVAGPDPASGSLTSAVAGTDGTDDAFDGVMKMVDIKLAFPEEYGQLVKIRIINTQLTDLSLCFGGVFEVGKNLPCVVPSLTTAVKNVTDVDETVYLDLLQVCYHKISEDPVDNQITARFGVMFKDGGSSPVALSVIVTEGTTDLAPISYSVSLVTATYIASNVTEGMKLELLDNTTTTVTQGQRLKTAVAFTFPPFATLPVEIGIMTPSGDGRAYVTVHGFSFRVGGSSNVGCLLEDCLLYKATVIQNSSFDVPMIHESQTDTLVANLKHITNHGMTHLHMTQKPEDDQIWLEADLLIADHTNATASGDIFTISFAVKAGNMIFVIEKELSLLVTGTEEITVATELEITEDTTAPFNPLAQISFTGRVHHDMNVSTEEANNALVRLYFPKYLGLVNDTVLGYPLDLWDSSIPGVVTYANYIDFNILHLFFTDELEINFTLTVDPDGLLPKGLGVVNATTIMRLVCVTKNDATPRYCSNTSYAMFQLYGPDCFDSLGLATMQDCQLSASSAIEATSDPAKAKTGSGGGWSPAVRSGAGWEHYITVDFLKKTRVTKIEFEAVTSTRKVTQFKMQFSHSGKYFSDACPDVLDVVNDVTELPLQCRFEARYGRILIVAADGTEGLAPIGVRFEWYGCPIEEVDSVCDASITTPLTDTTMGWRHVAHDPVSDIFYFCDFIPKKQRVQCYSTLDGEVWNAMPSYIARLVGFDAATEKMYAMDRKERAMVASSDGINWGIIDSASVAALQSTIDASTEKALPVPGKVSAMLVPVTFGSWTADFTGISLSGAYKAKWSTCCS